jgi:tripartite-type tricarboxylate transporter receptor subunit TctC
MWPTRPACWWSAPASPAGGATELIKLLKANPGKYNFGSSGIGTYPHLSAEMFKWRAGGLFVVHIPYRGTGLVITDLIAGPDHLPDGQHRLGADPHQATAGCGRWPSPARSARARCPQVPTFTELGVPGLAFSNWFGFFAPAGTPADIVERLNRELGEIDAQRRRAGTPEASLGADPVTGTPEAFAKVIRDEHDSWKAVIQRAGIKAE